MEDYPRDLLEFEVRFASEEACRDYLSALRWPEGFRCPDAGMSGLGRCAKCGSNALAAGGRRR